MQIRKEKVMKAVRATGPEGVKLPELADALELDQKNRSQLRRHLDEWVDAGELERAPGSRFRLPGLAAAAAASPPAAPPSSPRGDGAVGRIRVHPAGYGLVGRHDRPAD